MIGRGGGSHSLQNETETLLVALRGAAGAKRAHCISVRCRQTPCNAKAQSCTLRSKWWVTQVPAAAVIPGPRMPGSIIALKTCVAGPRRRLVKPENQSSGLRAATAVLGAGEATGIPGVAVKCVDPRRTIDGEGRLLERARR